MAQPLLTLPPQRKNWPVRLCSCKGKLMIESWVRNALTIPWQVQRHLHITSHAAATSLTMTTATGAMASDTGMIETVNYAGGRSVTHPMQFLSLSVQSLQWSPVHLQVLHARIYGRKRAVTTSLGDIFNRLDDQNEDLIYAWQTGAFTALRWLVDFYSSNLGLWLIAAQCTMKNELDNHVVIITSTSTSSLTHSRRGP